uniref:Amidase domain-containing protein n=1 Tax=Pavo cristatus TaxID=9049 RepID=A0A8C9L9Q5_PAVCR
MALSRVERFVVLLLRLVSRACLAVLGLLPASAPPRAANPAPARAVPPPRSALLLLPARELARRLRLRQVKCVEVVEAYVERIREVNPLINAVVKDRFEEALQEARQVDQLLAEGRADDSLEKYPFLGVPFTVKEAFSLHGMPNTSGLVKRRCVVATTDAIVVGRMKQAGAIPLGVTNCSELCMWYESSNNVYGRTSNPYNLQHIAGGSSGGEGSVLAAACSVIGVGSDIGGSIRMPAFFNGVFGHKPTTGDTWRRRAGREQAASCTGWTCCVEHSNGKPPDGKASSAGEVGGATASAWDVFPGQGCAAWVFSWQQGCNAHSAGVSQPAACPPCACWCGLQTFFSPYAQMEILQSIQSVFISNHTCCPSTGHHQENHRSSPCGLGPPAPSHLLLVLSLPSPQPHPTDSPTIRSSPQEAHPLGPSLGSPALNKALLLHRRCLVPPSPTSRSPTPPGQAQQMGDGFSSPVVVSMGRTSRWTRADTCGGNSTGSSWACELHCDDIHGIYWARVRAVQDGKLSPWVSSSELLPYRDTIVGPPTLSWQLQGHNLSINLSAPLTPYQSRHGSYRPLSRVLRKLRYHLRLYHGDVLQQEVCDGAGGPGGGGGTGVLWSPYPVVLG